MRCLAQSVWPVAWRTMLILVFSVLCGCVGQRPESVVNAEDGIRVRYENAVKNQRTIKDGYRAAYIEEAKGHIESKRAWSIERIDNQARTGKMPDGSDVTSDKIAAGYQHVYQKRDEALVSVAKHVQDAEASQQKVDADLSQARKLFKGVRAYDEAPAVGVDVVPVFVELLTPVVTKDKGEPDG